MPWNAAANVRLVLRPYKAAANVAAAALAAQFTVSPSVRAGTGRRA
jgi:hypothetical protein